MEIKSHWKVDICSEVQKYAHEMVAAAIKCGVLYRSPCEICGSRKYIDAHHDDYSLPLSVRWLCRSHHLMTHRNKNFYAGTYKSHREFDSARLRGFLTDAQIRQYDQSVISAKHRLKRMNLKRIVNPNTNRKKQLIYDRLMVISAGLEPSERKKQLGEIRKGERLRISRKRISNRLRRAKDRNDNARRGYERAMKSREMKVATGKSEH